MEKETIVDTKFKKGDLVVSRNNGRLTYRVLGLEGPNELGNQDYRVEVFTDGKPGIRDGERCLVQHKITRIEQRKMDSWGLLIECSDGDAGRASVCPFGSPDEYTAFTAANCSVCGQGSVIETDEGDLEAKTVYRCPIEREINDMMCGECGTVSEPTFNICRLYSEIGFVCPKKTEAGTASSEPSVGANRTRLTASWSELRGGATITLHLVLASRWFDMTASGLKKEEYRRICDHWKKRIWNRRAEISEVVLHRGYTSTTVTRKVKEIVAAIGNPAWGAEPGVEYYVIRYAEEEV